MQSRKHLEIFVMFGSLIDWLHYLTALVPVLVPVLALVLTLCLVLLVDIMQERIPHVCLHAALQILLINASCFSEVFLTTFTSMKLNVNFFVM